MPMGKRGWLGIGGIVITSAGLFVGGNSFLAAVERGSAAARSHAAAGHLTDADLVNMIRAMGFQVKTEERRHDFEFPATYNKEPWNLTMSTVLSEDGNSIWVMAWLDACPKSAADVPRAALLRLLASNDSMGNGKFFAYIKGNNRFVLQRVIANDNMSTAKFQQVLQDLGASVVETYPIWSVANWKQRPVDQGASAGGTASGAAPAAGAASAPVNQATPQSSDGRQPAAGRSFDR